jgi:ACS family glucarate transporter-like MFS transporter
MLGSEPAILEDKPIEAVQSRSHTRWLVVAVLFLINTVTFLDRLNMSVAGHFVMLEFHLTEVQMGSIFSAFFFGYSVFQIPGGWLGDRFGPRRVLAGAVVWGSIFTAMTAIAGNSFLASLLGAFGVFLVVRTLIGAGEAAATPNCSRVIASWAAPQERGVALGIAFSGLTFGAASTPPLIAWIMTTWGWRVAFYVCGAIGVVVAALWYAVSTDRPADHPWVNQAELEHLSQSVPSKQSEPVPWRVVLRRSDLWFLTAAYFAFGYVLFVYLSWFYLYLVHERKFSVTHGGFYAMLPFLVSTLTVALGGLVTDWVTRRLGKSRGRRTLGFSSFALSALLTVAGASAKSPYWAVAYFTLGAGTLYASMSAFWSSSTDLGKTHAGTVSGFMNTGGNLGGVVSPTLTPLLAKYFGWEHALYATAAMAVIGAFLWLGVNHFEPIVSESDADAPQPVRLKVV